MKKQFLFIIGLIAISNVFAQKETKCIIKTELGDITLELYPEKAPITVNNFLRYVDNHLYDSTTFYRVCTKENEANREIQIEVIQAADIPEYKSFDPIPLETTQTTGILHKNGTISMARDKPISATSSFFICINDQPELDYGGKRNNDGQGFAAFGKVFDGMDVVKKIQEKENIDQMLLEPVLIYTIIRVNENK